MCLTVTLMTVVALVWLGYEFWRLLWQSSAIWQSSPPGAVDLQLRHGEVRHWFAGRPIYSEIGSAVYPPASYVILWPLLGWLAVTPARWLWAVTTVAALGWLVYLVIRESGANTRLERVFVALIPLSMYATGATIGNGQLSVHLLPTLVAGLSMPHQGQCGWRKDFIAAALVLVALVKPSVSAPFFWVVLFVPGRLRPAILVVLGYILLTLLAAGFQEASVLSLIGDWLGRAQAGVEWGAVNGGAGNLHSWLSAVRLPAWNLPSSLLVSSALGVWVYCHRHVDLWLLLGVTALVARFWTYHGWYDDLLILLPIVSLFRIAKRGGSADRDAVVAGALMAITLLAMLAPGGLYLFPQPWNTLYVAGQIIVWTTVLIFLLGRTWREKYRTLAGSGANPAWS
jgi:hypothetical protein